MKFRTLILAALLISPALSYAHGGMPVYTITPAAITDFIRALGYITYHYAEKLCKCTKRATIERQN